MQRNWKKRWPTAAASFVLLTSFARADVDSAQMRNLENRVTALEQRRGASGMINPPGRPQVKGGCDLFITADFLIWNAHENGLPIAIRNKGSTTNISNAKVVNLDFDWDPGFRVGIGYNTMHDGWDIYLNYLHFNTHARAHTSADGGNADFASQGIENDSFNTKSKSRWRLNLNQIDLDLGREFYVSKWLTLRPNFGLRTAWINQHLKTHYDGFDYIVSENTSVSAKNRYWGLGVVSGLDTQWGLGGGWSIYGNCAFSILYGFFDNELSDDTVAVDDFADLSNSYRTSRVIADLQLGLRWDHMFAHDRYHLGLQAGWENHVYFGQNQFERFYTNIADNNLGGVFANQGDLTLQGWTIAGRFDF